MANGSTTAAPSASRTSGLPASLPAVVQVRAKQDGWLTAKLAGEQAGQMVRTARQTLVVPGPTDYVIYSGNTVLDVVAADKLTKQYELKAEGALLIGGPTRRVIEEITGVGSTATELDLVAGVQRLARLKIGEQQIDFTPGQWEELARRAERNGRSVADEVSKVVARIEDELFHGGVARAAGGR